MFRGVSHQAAHRRTSVLLIAVLSAFILASVVLVLVPGAAADHAPTPTIHGRLLTTPGYNAFTDDVAVQVRDRPDGRPTSVANLKDASHIVVMEFTIDPGAMFPWHTHPGPVLVAIADGDDDGAFIFVFDDCAENPYEVGDAFVDPGTVHMAYNPSETEPTVVIATFLGVPANEPVTTAVPNQGELDDLCGISRPAATAHH
jgi:quercetin dioxygenase-like cupin family protein